MRCRYKRMKDQMSVLLQVLLVTTFMLIACRASVMLIFVQALKISCDHTLEITQRPDSLQELLDMDGTPLDNKRNSCYWQQVSAILVVWRMLWCTINIQLSPRRREWAKYKAILTQVWSWNSNDKVKTSQHCQKHNHPPAPLVALLPAVPPPQHPSLPHPQSLQPWTPQRCALPLDEWQESAPLRMREAEIEITCPTKISSVIHVGDGSKDSSQWIIKSHTVVPMIV